jgi:hypothetical protein
MTDYYPDEEGHIDDGLVIGYAKAGMSISLGQAVALNVTTVTSYVSVTAAAFNTGVGVALKAANTNDYIPVCFYGVCKMVGDTAVVPTAGMAVVSGTTAGQVTGLVTTTSATVIQLAQNNGAGTIHLLGMALQTATTTADEILVLVGGAR